MGVISNLLADPPCTILTTIPILRYQTGPKTYMTFTMGLDANSSVNNFDQVKDWMETILSIKEEEGVEVFQEPEPSTTQRTTVARPGRNQVHPPDIEMAVEYSLRTELANQEWVMEAGQTSILQWLHTLLLYAPLRLEVKELLHDLRSNMTSRAEAGETAVSGSEWASLVEGLVTNEV